MQKLYSFSTLPFSSLYLNSPKAPFYVFHAFPILVLKSPLTMVMSWFVKLWIVFCSEVQNSSMPSLVEFEGGVYTWLIVGFSTWGFIFCPQYMWSNCIISHQSSDCHLFLILDFYQLPPGAFYPVFLSRLYIFSHPFKIFLCQSILFPIPWWCPIGHFRAGEAVYLGEQACLMFVRSSGDICLYATVK